MGEGISTPAGMGGLVRYNEEYKSKLMISPEQVIVLIVAVVIGMVVMKFLT
jgi:preprotein translocase subunit Sec61beta